MWGVEAFIAFISKIAGNSKTTINDARNMDPVEAARHARRWRSNRQ
jgi:hypothetical protein